METLFLVHDFAGVLEAFERDLKDSEEDATNPDLMHLAATAACYLGQKDEAKRLWLNTLEQMPDHSLAKDNLADVDLPEGESHGPFAFRSAYWFDGRLLEAMLDTANQVDAISEEASQRAYRKLIRQHPEVVSIASLIFELGDPVTTQLMISLVHASAAPELAESMRKFAMGHRGSDQMRLKALSFAHSEGDETTAPVAFWAQGQETEVSLRGYEIYEDAYTDTDAIPAMLPHVYELYEASINLSNDGEFHQAELLINRALTFEPDNPRLRNNLAAVLGAQGTPYGSVGTDRRNSHTQSRLFLWSM